MTTLTITKPVTLVLAPDELAFVLDSIAERPLKVAIGVFQKIYGQAQAQQEAKEGPAKTE